MKPALVAFFLSGWCAVALAQTLNMGQGIGDLPTTSGRPGAPAPPGCTTNFSFKLNDTCNSIMASGVL